MHWAVYWVLVAWCTFVGAFVLGILVELWQYLHFKRLMEMTVWNFTLKRLALSDPETFEKLGGKLETDADRSRVAKHRS